MNEEETMNVPKRKVDVLAEPFKPDAFFGDVWADHDMEEAIKAVPGVVAADWSGHDQNFFVRIDHRYTASEVWGSIAALKTS